MDSATTASDELVLVDKRWFDLLYNHFCDCANVDEQLRECVPSPKPASQRNGPERRQPDGRTRKRKKQTDGREGISLAWIRHQMPEQGRWRAWQLRFLGGQSHYQSVVENLTVCVEPTAGDRGRSRPNNDLVAIGLGLARLTQTSMESRDLLNAVSSFQLLLLSTYCSFLEKYGFTNDVIDSILQQVTSLRELDRRKLPKRALQINKLINRLVGSGWDLHRSTELFFLLAIPISYLTRLKVEDSDTLFDDFISKNYETDFDSCPSVEYSIPGLLKTHLDRVYPGNEITLSKIFTDTGYDIRQPPIITYILSAETSSRRESEIDNGSPTRNHGRSNTRSLLNANPITQPSLEHNIRHRQANQVSSASKHGNADMLNPATDDDASTAFITSITQSPTPATRSERDEVHPAKSTSSCSGHMESENLTRGSFVAAVVREGTNHEEGEDQSTTIRAEQSLHALICEIRAIPKFMLERALNPQQRWTEYGEDYQIDPRKAQFGDHLKALFLDSNRLWQVLEHLIKLTAIGVEKYDNMEFYISGATPAEYMYGQERSYWIEQALWFFCYTFPRNPTTLAVSEREKLLAVFEDFLRRYAETGLEIPSNDEVIETLLAASKYGPLSRRRQILSRVDQLLQKTASVHLQAEAVYEMSVVLRLRGDVSDSNKLLREFLDRADLTARLQSHSIIALLHVSQATNYAYNFDFLSADQEAKPWVPVELDGTEKQLDLIWTQLHFSGRVMRGRGDFQSACLLFERCLERKPLRESRRHLALAYLVDTYIEVDYLQRRGIHLRSAGELLDGAAKLIKPVIDSMKHRAPQSKGYRRLLLALSEIEIRKSQFEAAKLSLAELVGFYEELIDPDIVDRLGHVRTLIALARISPLSEAETLWNDALNLGRRYNPLEEEVFTVALIHLFICVVRLQRENFEGARAAFDYAAGISRTKSPQYLIPGAGTFLFDDVQRQIESLAGWKLPRCGS